jgi:hypothetical protein
MDWDEPLCGHRLPDAEFLQEGDVTRAERIDTRIQGFRSPWPPALVRDQCHRQSARRAGEACADGTTADDDEIVLGRVYNRAFKSVAN